MPLRPNTEPPGRSQNLFLSKFSKYNLKTDVAAQIAIRGKDSEPSGAIPANRGHVLAVRERATEHIIERST